jgi:large subunit ribosomal protein L13
MAEAKKTKMATPQKKPLKKAVKKSTGPKRSTRPKTTHLTKEDALNRREWLHVDAKEQVLGRLSTKIASILRGKHKPEYSPHVDTGDYVIVTNASDVKLTGDKWKQKKYYHHTGYMGHLRSRTAEELKSKKPEALVRNAVKGMLPHTTLGKHMLKKLKIFAGATHEHASQNPKTITLGS